MSRISLLLDEDVRLVLAEILRGRGYDVVHVLEIGRAGKSDPDQLAFAVRQERTILTHNVRDYRLLDQTYREQEKVHWGIIVSDQLPLKELVSRTLRCLSRYTKEDAKNSLLWLHDFK